LPSLAREQEPSVSKIVSLLIRFLNMRSIEPANVTRKEREVIKKTGLWKISGIQTNIFLLFMAFLPQSKTTLRYKELTQPWELQLEPNELTKKTVQQSRSSRVQV